MTLTQLSYLISLDTHRHFGKAAEHCFVSQPTLSIQIQRLEEELDVLLFDRTRKPVVPTSVGKLVIAQARLVVRESQRIGDVVAEARGEVAGTITVGVISTLAPYVLPLLLPVFCERYPKVHLVVRERLTDQIQEGLADDTLDVGLIAASLLASKFRSVPLFVEPFLAYLPVGHHLADADALRPADLRGENVWLLQQGHCFRDQALRVCHDQQGEGIQAAVRFEGSSLDTLIKMVDHVGGLTLLPYLATTYLSDVEVEDQIRPFADPAPGRQIYLVMRRGYLKRRLIEALQRTLLDVLPAALPRMTEAL
ncbi:MAG: LysR substrate-binding domain-containing protein [Bacteroidota bacterium]